MQLAVHAADDLRGLPLANNQLVLMVMQAANKNRPHFLYPGVWVRGALVKGTHYRVYEGHAVLILDSSTKRFAASIWITPVIGQVRG